MSIAQRLRALHEARCWSQGRIEEGIGLLCLSVFRVERRHNLPEFKMLERWAKPLNLQLNGLFCEDKRKPIARKFPIETVLAR